MRGSVLWRSQQTKEFDGQSGQEVRSIPLSAVLSVVLLLAFIISLLPATPPVHAQAPGGGERPWVWRAFTPENSGVLSNVVNFVFEDRTGALWFGTGGGVSRYYKGKWHIFTIENTSGGLVSNSVEGIFEDRTGNLWFRTYDKGVSRYFQGQWEPFTAENSGLASNHVNMIVEDGAGALWFGTGGGVSRYFQGQWETFTTENSGLAANRVTEIVEDKAGGLWFAAYDWNTGVGGVSRYFQRRWQAFTMENTGGGLVGNYVGSIFEDSSGALWFGTQSRWDSEKEKYVGGGVSRYYEREWQGFTLESVSDGLVSGWVDTTFEDHTGALWFAIGSQDARWGGVTTRYHNGEWEVFTIESIGGGLAGDRVNLIFEDRTGALWFTVTPGWSNEKQEYFGGGVSRYYEGEWQAFTPENTNGGLVNGWVETIFEDHTGALWFAIGGWDARSGGVSRYHNGEWQASTVENTNSGLVSSSVYDILQDQSGALWFRTGEGVSCCREGQWGTFTIENTDGGLASEWVNTILEDRNGALWFSTDDGVSRFHQGQWQVFTAESIDGGEVGNQISVALEDHTGALWFIAWGLQESPLDIVGGVIHYDKGEWQIFTVESTDGGLVNDWVNTIVEDRTGALWFSTSEGLSRYFKGQWQVFTVENTDGALAGNGIKAVLEDHTGALWFGTDEGLSRYHDGEWQTFTVESTGGGLASNRVDVIWEDRTGDLWFIAYDVYDWDTESGGLSHYNGERWEAFTTESTNGGLASDDIRVILEDYTGALWLGTDMGVSRYQEGQWQLFTEENTGGGLVSNNVWEILEDHTGTLWFAVEGWLPRLAGVSRYSEGEWQVLSPEGVALSPGYRIEPLLEDSSGSVWFNLSGYQTMDASGRLMSQKPGIIRYYPGANPPWVILHWVEEEGKGKQILPKDRPAQLRLGYPGPSFQIKFMGGDLESDPRNIKYRCKLEGFDADWYTTDETIVRYANVPPGQYTFTVQAFDGDFMTSVPATLTISIVSTIPPTSTPTPLPTPTPIVIIRVEPQTVDLPGFGPMPLKDFIAALLGSVAGLALLSLGISRWQASRRTRHAIERKFNPYKAGGPVEVKMFFGREEALAEVLVTIHRNHVAIYGERRIGKTSLLHQLDNRLRQVEEPEYLFIPAFVRLQGVPAERFFYTLMSAIAKSCQPRVSPLDLICVTKKEGYDDYDLVDDLEMVLEALAATTDKQIKLVLLLDEGDELNKYDPKVQARLRGIFMTGVGQYLRIVWSGLSIDKEWKLDTSPWYNLFAIGIHLAPFTREEALRLIQEPVKGIYRYDKDAIELILQYSERKPFRIQQICLATINHVLAQKRRRVTGPIRVTKEDVEKAHQSLMAEEAISREAEEWSKVGLLEKQVAEGGAEYQVNTNGQGDQ